MLSLRTYALTLTLALVAVTSTRAQDPPSQNQNPPAQEPTAPAQPLPPDQSAEGNQDKSKPDDQPISPVVAGTVVDAPLTGAAMPILGLVRSRSYVVPSLAYYGLLDSNANNAAGNYQFTSINALMGSVAVQKLGRASQLNLGYLIGRSFSSSGGEFNSTTHDLTASDLWSRGRWDGFVYEKLLYSSEAGLLGGALPYNISGLDTMGSLVSTGPITLHTTFLPGQGIFTSFGPRLSNATVAQINNHVSRRTYFTLVGNYNTLHFFNSNLINTSAAGFQAGFGYQRTRQDSIAVVYRFNDFWFGALPIGVRDHVVELAYQRQLGQRLLFQVGAGPEISFIRDAALVGTPGTPLPATTRSSWSLDTSLQYRLRRTVLQGGYDHYLTGGSGVFLGAITDRAHVAYSREVSRVWSTSATLSYGHNVNLVPLFTQNQNVPANASYDSVYGGISFQRRIGRDSEVFFGYLGRYQSSNYVACLTGICKSADLVGHQVNFGIAWRLRPFPVD